MLSTFNAKKIRVEQIRAALVSDFGYHPDQVEQITGKYKLIELYNQEREKRVKSQELAALGDVGDLYKPENIPQEILTPANDKWTSYVLDQLAPEEMADGYPKANGLRRLIEKLIGEIVYQDSDIYTSPNNIGGLYATVKHIVKIVNHDGDYGDTYQYCGSVDVRADLLQHPFSNHLIATAETKAESRAFKRALKINVSTAEEMDRTERVFVPPPEIEGQIDQTQISAIHVLSGRLDIDLPKFLLETVNKSDLNVLTSEEAQTCFNKLHILQRQQAEVSNDNS